MAQSNLAQKEEFQVKGEPQEEEKKFQVIVGPHRVYPNNMIIGSERPQSLLTRLSIPSLLKKEGFLLYIKKSPFSERAFFCFGGQP